MPDGFPGFRPESEPDPLKRGAILLASRLLTYIRSALEIRENLDTVSQQHLADALCQGISWLYHKYVKLDWIDGKKTSKFHRTMELPVEYPYEGDLKIENVLTLPRSSRKRPRQTNTVRSVGAF